MFGTQYYFCSMFCTENWVVVRVKLTMRLMVVFVEFVIKAIFVAMYLCHWLCSQDVIVGMYMVFLYILVFVFMFKTVKVVVTAERNWGDVNLFKPCWSLAYVKKNVSLLQASRRHDQDSWCRIFVTTTLQQNC